MMTRPTHPTPSPANQAAFDNTRMCINPTPHPPRPDHPKRHKNPPRFVLLPLLPSSSPPPPPRGGVSLPPPFWGGPPPLPQLVPIKAKYDIHKGHLPQIFSPFSSYSINPYHPPPHPSPFPPPSPLPPHYLSIHPRGGYRGCLREREREPNPSCPVHSPRTAPASPPHTR